MVACNSLRNFCNGNPIDITFIIFQEDQKTLKSKMREKIRPKMGKIDIDYQKLHDAFFRWQTKPKMTIHGDLYYEVNIDKIFVINN